MWNRLGFRDRLLLVGFGMMVLMLMALGGGASTLVDRHLRGELQARVEQITPLFNAALGAPMAQRDYASVAAIIEEIRGTRDLVYVEVLDSAGRAVTAPRASNASTADTMSFSATLDLAGQPLGRVDFGLSRKAIDETRQSILLGIALLSAASLAVFSLVLAVFSMAVTRPLKILITAARDIQAGNYEVDLRTVRRDEFGVLMKTFVKMTQEIQRKVSELVHSENLQRRYLQESIRHQHETTLALQEAQAANRVKAEFIANMSHEIRTPMNSIMGYADLLRLTALGPQQKAYLGRLQDSGAALLALINDILDFSKIEAGQLKSSSESFDLRALIDTVCGLFTPHLREKGLVLDLEIELDVPPLLTADRLRLQQILVNLLGNAVKFTLQGQITVRAQRLRLQQTAMTDEVDQPPLHIRLAIHDTGIGIAREQLEQVFQPFAQADGSITRRFGGTGLGLSISRSLAELMGGRLEVESQLGVGSEFAVIFPCSAASSGGVASQRPVDTPATRIARNDMQPPVATEDPAVLQPPAVVAALVHAPDMTPAARPALPAQTQQALAQLLPELNRALEGKMMRARQLAEETASLLEGSGWEASFSPVAVETRKLRFVQAREALLVFMRLPPHAEGGK